MTAILLLYTTCWQCHKSRHVKYYTNLVSLHLYVNDAQLYRYKPVYACTSSRINRILHPKSPQLAALNNGLHLNPSKSGAIFSTQCLNNLSKAWLNTFHLFQLPANHHAIHPLITIFGVHVDSKISFASRYLKRSKVYPFHMCALCHNTFDLPLRLARRYLYVDYFDSLHAATSVQNCLVNNLFRIHSLKLVPMNFVYSHHTSSFWSVLTSCLPHTKFQDSYTYNDSVGVSSAILSYCLLYMVIFYTIVHISAFNAFNFWLTSML